MRTRALLVVTLGTVATLAAACSSANDGANDGAGGPAAPATPPAVAAAKPTLDEHGAPVGLHNYHPLAGKITSGAQPEGEEAFRNLAALGFTTIVSVDGALPDVATAKKYGLRYVHVPTQYSGVKTEEQLQIVKAIEVSDGPVYVHCHHGKHRSPAAAAAACVSLGLMTHEQALAAMKEVGTDPKYQGLYRDAAAARPFTAEELAAIPADLPEAVKPGDLAASMVDVDLRWEHLKASKAAKWGVPPESPDVDPPHEARMLWEMYREIARLDDAKQHGEKFLADLTEGEAAAKALEDALRSKNLEGANAAFERGGKTCSSCHKKFRDN